MIGTVSNVQCRDCDALLIDEGTVFRCLDCGGVFPQEFKVNADE
jgi:hypothetical protein